MGGGGGGGGGRREREGGNIYIIKINYIFSPEHCCLATQSIDSWVYSHGMSHPN